MDVKTTFLISILGFGPLIFLLWLTFRKYSYPHTEYTYFDDRKVAYSLGGGMGIGLVLFVCYRFAPPYLIEYAILFALVESLLKMVILNFPKLQSKFDTPFYGCALGFGIGSMILIGFAYSTEKTTGLWSVNIIFLTLVFGFQLCLLHSSTGLLIGYGSYKRKIWTFTALAGGIHLFYNIPIISFLRWDEWAYPSLAVGMLVAILIYIYAVKYILPSALPEKLLKKRLREIRKLRLKRDKKIYT